MASHVEKAVNELGPTIRSFLPVSAIESDIAKFVVAQIIGEAKL